MAFEKFLCSTDGIVVVSVIALYFTVGVWYTRNYSSRNIDDVDYQDGTSNFLLPIFWALFPLFFVCHMVWVIWRGFARFLTPRDKVA